MIINTNKQLLPPRRRKNRNVKVQMLKSSNFVLFMMLYPLLYRPVYQEIRRIFIRQLPGI